MDTDRLLCYNFNAKKKNEILDRHSIATHFK